MSKIDLVILDLIMPGMGGREAYNQMRALRHDQPVIFMTGHAPEMFKEELADANSAILVQKPYDLDELGRKVRQVLDAHSLRSPQ
jgi:DNA-binding response OmpR family regulator